MGIFSITALIGRAIGLVIGFTLHEWAHAWSAYRLGDDTARYQGRLSLDPRVHLEPAGIILALLTGFGWAKPVPVNPMAFYPNYKRGLVIVSLAGPLMNLLIAAVFGLFIRLLTLGGLFEQVTGKLVGSGKIVDYGIGSSGVTDFFYEVLGAVVLLNLVLFLFNLLPFSPLDGYKIAVGTLSRETAAWFIRYERETTLALVMLLMVGVINERLNILWLVLGPPLKWLYEVFTNFYPVFG